MAVNPTATDFLLAAPTGIESTAAASMVATGGEVAKVD